MPNVKNYSFLSFQTSHFRFKPPQKTYSHQLFRHTLFPSAIGNPFSIHLSIHPMATEKEKGDPDG
jgi:hypothetical protein